MLNFCREWVHPCLPMKKIDNRMEISYGIVSEDILISSPQADYLFTPPTRRKQHAQAASRPAIRWRWPLPPGRPGKSRSRSSCFWKAFWRPSAIAGTWSRRRAHPDQGVGGYQHSQGATDPFERPHGPLEVLDGLLQLPCRLVHRPLDAWSQALQGRLDLGLESFPCPGDRVRGGAQFLDR
jgi:hypothetical protein